jgi:TonB family protein
MSQMMNVYLLLLLVLTTQNAFAQTDSVESTSVILVTEPIPHFPGGYATLNKFMRKNLAHPKQTPRIHGRVLVEFVVNKDGSLSDFRVVKGLSESYDASALDMVRKMPAWIPARMDGVPTTTKMVLPVTFD